MPVNETCVDASLIVKLALRDETLRFQARRLMEDVIATDTDMIAPPIFESELDGIVRRRVYEGRLTQAQAQLAYDALDAIEVITLNPAGLRQRAREIASQFNQRVVYDSTYAALAELRGCDFWTADRAFYEVVRADLSFVKYLADYP